MSSVLSLMSLLTPFFFNFKCATEPPKTYIAYTIKIISIKSLDRTKHASHIHMISVFDYFLS